MTIVAAHYLILMVALVGLWKSAKRRGVTVWPFITAAVLGHMLIAPIVIFAQLAYILILPIEVLWMGLVFAVFYFSGGGTRSVEGSWRCPDCGHFNPPKTHACLCGFDSSKPNAAPADRPVEGWISSLPFETLTNRTRRPALGAAMIGASFILTLLVPVIFLAAGFAPLTYWHRASGNTSPLIFGLIAIGSYTGGFFALGWTRKSIGLLATKGRGHRMIDPHTLLARDKRAPVLYLRSFDDDDVPDLNGYHYKFGVARTLEMSLAEPMSGIGPLLSIGRPGEELPLIGANRLYVADEDWQKAVEHLLDIARAVVVVVGLSPGVAWEIGAAVALREKVIFIFPYIQPTGQTSRRRLLVGALVRLFANGRLSKDMLADVVQEREARYIEFRTILEEKCQVELPERLGTSIAIEFPGGQAPQLLKTVLPLGLPKEIDAQGVTVDYGKTLRPFLDRIQIRTTEPDIVERVYANTKLLSRIAWSLWGIAALVPLVSLMLVAFRTNDMSLAFRWAFGSAVFLGLTLGNAGFLFYKLSRRGRAVK